MINPLWSELAARAGIILEPERHDLLHRYLDLMREANQRMNLTRIVEPGEMELLHVGDALTALPFLPAGKHRLADVGSGGGVPGIVLAIARPDAEVVLIESTKKKADFLIAAIGQLGLGHTTVVPLRAEEAGIGKLRETCQIAIARSVATMPWLAEWLLPLVRRGGAMLAMKGPKIAEELPPARRTIRKMGGGEAEVLPVNLPGREGHVIVRIKKIGRTEARYPRPAPMAKGNPLL